MGDLGAESIDFLDIVFRLEKGFNIKIPQGELMPEDVLKDTRYVVDGKVTETGLAELRKRMPYANLDEFAQNPVVQDFTKLFTVADLCRFVEGKARRDRIEVVRMWACPRIAVGMRESEMLQRAHGA